MHVARINLFDADVEFVVVSLHNPDGRQTSVVLQHVLISAVGLHGTSLVCSPLGKKHKFVAHVVEARQRAASVAGMARRTITTDFLCHDATAVMI